MPRLLRKLARFWLKYVHPRLASLIATIGIVGLASCLTVLFVLASIAEEVLEREAFAFDKTILLAIHQFANPTFDTVMLKITELGNHNTVVPIAAVSLGILWWKHYRQEAKIFAIACLGGAILSTGLNSLLVKPVRSFGHS